MRASLVFCFLRVQATERCRRKSKTLGGCRGLFPVVVAENSLAGSSRKSRSMASVHASEA